MAEDVGKAIMVEDDEKSIFLYRLKHVHPDIIFYHKENVFGPLSIYHNRANDKNVQNLYEDIEYFKRISDLPNAINFDDVKHYPYDELAIFTNDLHKLYWLDTCIFGRFLKGWIEMDSGLDKDVIIKTWDINYLPQRDYKLHVVRLHNELTFLMDALKRKPHSCLPKLIGYSIDKRLAVIYDLKPELTLRKLLDAHDNFPLRARLYTAIEVANMLRYFHDDNITIGSIDSMNLIFDFEDDDKPLKLCEFGLTVRSPNITDLHDDIPPWWYVNGVHYRRHHEKLYSSEDGRWPISSDIFAFGFLLLELIFCSPRNLVNKMTFIRVLPSSRPMPDHFGSLDTSIIEDVEIGVNLRTLAWNCLQEDPSNRPKAIDVYNELISIMDKAVPDPLLCIESKSADPAAVIIDEPEQPQLYQVIGKTFIGESEGLAGDQIPGKESSIPELENYVLKQDMQAYSLDTNLCLLRRYKGEPKMMNTEIVGCILVKALMAKPAPDFGLCLALIPKNVQKKNPIKTLIALSDYLKEAKFSKFWDRAGSICKDVPVIR